MSKDTRIFDFNEYFMNKQSKAKKQTKKSGTKQKASKKNTFMDELNKISIKGVGIGNVARRLGRNNGDVIYRYRLLVKEGIVPEGKPLTDAAVELIELMFGDKGPFLELHDALVEDPTLRERIANSYNDDKEEEDDEYYSFPSYEPGDEYADEEPKYDFDKQMQGVLDALEEQNRHLERIVEHISADGEYIREVASELDALVDAVEYFTGIFKGAMNKKGKKITKLFG